MLTPVKLVKGEDSSIRQREKAYRDLFGKAVSSVRQPVESFFNWLNEKNRNPRGTKSKVNKRINGTHVWKNRSSIHFSNFLTLDSHYYKDN
jgi:hypothetical protein